MAIVTNTLLTTMEWAKKLNFGRRSAIGNYLEPALTSGNIIKQTILGPPFCWWWNNEDLTFSCVQGTQDYNISAPEFGFIDHAAVQDPVSSAWYQVTEKNDLSPDSNQGRPQFISPQNEDSAGLVTFRLMPVPDKAYNVKINITKAASLFATVNDTWAPIPDYMSYIYSWGFLSLMYMFADDPRFQIANQKFVAGLLGAAQGLTDQERNIFLNNWGALTSSQAQQTAQGIQARGV